MQDSTPFYKWLFTLFTRAIRFETTSDERYKNETAESYAGSLKMKQLIREYYFKKSESPEKGYRLATKIDTNAKLPYF